MLVIYNPLILLFDKVIPFETIYRIINTNTNKKKANSFYLSLNKNQNNKLERIIFTSSYLMSEA